MLDDMAEARKGSEKAIIRARISFAFVLFGLVFTSAWLALTALSGELPVFLIGALAFSGFVAARLLASHLPLAWGNTLWLGSTDLAIFLGACVVHPAGGVATILIPMAGFPFAVFSLHRERGHIAAMIAVPVLLWVTWFVLHDGLSPLIGAEMATRFYAPMSGATAFSIIIFQVFYFAFVSKTYEAELEEATRQADQTSRAKTVLLSGISHEMRTPLSAVIGLADLIEEDAAKREDRQQALYAGRIMEAGKTLLSTIENTVQFADLAARRAPVTLSAVRVATVIEDVRTQYRATVREDAIRLSQPDCPLEVWADRTMLTDILSHLVENALRYSGPEGTVSIGITPARDDQVRVTVADDGPGFLTDDPEQAFAPFERLDQATGTTFGAGMGLAIARLKAEAMQGRVGIDQTVSHGALVWVELPRATGASA